jgi:hypothetical protein
MSAQALSAQALMILLTLGATACGNLTAGGFGEATVVVSGDASEPAPASQVTPQFSAQPTAEGPTRPYLSSHDGELVGDVEVEFALFLVAEDGDALRLGRDTIRVAVDLVGDTEADAVDRQRVPATRYTELRIVFTDIDVEVESGLIIDGIPIVGLVEVEIEDVTLLVTRQIDLDVDMEESVELVIDLNAPAWLEALDPLTLSVDEAVFASLIDVAVR